MTHFIHPDDDEAKKRVWVSWSKENVLKNMTSDIAESYVPNTEAGVKYEQLYQAYLQAAAWYESRENPPVT